MLRQVVILALLLLFGIAPLSAQSSAQDWRKAKRKINKVLDYLKDNYVDEVPLDKVVESALSATLDELDPHTRYLPRKEMEQMYERLRSQFAGIGTSYILYHDTLIVRRVVSGSPAARHGLLYNDRIIGIDSRSIRDIAPDSIRDLLRGRSGTTVTLDIERRSDSTHRSITIEREVIESPSISIATILKDSIAYIGIESFARTTGQEVRRALATLEGYNSLILDLRGNAGGVLTSVVDICGLFLDKGDIIVSTEGRCEREHYHRASRRGEYTDLPLVVLIDEQSASASEILAGAIQDHDRGVIIGRTSYGKGLVQRLINLGDGDGMTVTRARYKTPSGRIIQRPYSVGNRSDYINDRSRYNHPDLIAHDTMMVYRTLRQGRKVYGGGGITPDIYVAAKVGDANSYIGYALRNNVITEVTVELFDRISCNDFYSAYPTPRSYADGFMLDSISQSVIKRLIPDSLATPEEKLILHEMIRSAMAKDLYNEEAYLALSMRFDDVLMRAIEYLTSNSTE